MSLLLHKIRNEPLFCRTNVNGRAGVFVCMGACFELVFINTFPFLSVVRNVNMAVAHEPPVDTRYSALPQFNLTGLDRELHQLFSPSTTSRHFSFINPLLLKHMDMAKTTKPTTEISIIGTQ